MADEPAVLDTDTLSALSRGNPHVTERARAYLAGFGRLTITSVTVFERLRGYGVSIRDGKPFERQLQAFEVLVANCTVLPFDQEAARVAAQIWSAVTRGQRQLLGDILIASIAASRRLPLVTRNKRDFERLASASGVALRLTDWSGLARRSQRLEIYTPGRIREFDKAEAELRGVLPGPKGKKRGRR
jgi:predicted nucleic acid-binding protein